MEKFVDLKASKREQAYQWGQISDAMVIASRNAMVDANAAARLNFISPPQTYAQFKAKWGPEKGGNELWDKIIAEAKRQLREPGCFVAGTLVHTKEGLRPIEQIKVGDLVLSKPESGEGEQSYQPVTKAFSYENRELYLLPITELDRVTKKPLRYETQYLAVSGSHPIWVEYYSQLYGKLAGDELVFETINTPVNDWVTVEDYYLKVWQAMEDWYEKETPPPKAYAVLANGSSVVIDAPYRILQGRLPNEGVQFSDHNSESWDDGCIGKTIRFGMRGAEVPQGPGSYTRLGDAEDANYDYTGYDVDSPMSLIKRSGGHLPMRRTVYNIEVANTHSYFVGELGLWVHNKNSSSVPLLPSVAQNVTQNLGVYVTQNGLALFHAALKKIPGNRGIGITPDGTVGSKLTDPLRAQAMFVGSITESGVTTEGPVIGDKVLAYTLGGINPIKGGYPSTALGDALAWVVKNGKKLFASNVLVDVKASGFGFSTPVMERYIEASRAGLISPAIIEKTARDIAKTLLQRSAFLEQAPEFLGA